MSGIALGPGSDNVITRNHVSRGGNGIAVAMGHDNLIAHNVVARTDIGISLGVTGAGPLSGARSMVRRNLVRDSRKDGYFVRNKDRHSRLMGNVATGSGDDGFDIESRSARLTRNRASTTAISASRRSSGSTTAVATAPATTATRASARTSCVTDHRAGLSSVGR